MSYLPYVETLLSLDPTIHFLSLVRNRTEIVRSFEKKVGAKGNRWQRHDGTGQWERKLPWDEAFPKFDHSETRHEAIGAYVDLYRTMEHKLQLRFPSAFMACNMDSFLNDAKYQLEVLMWLGVEDPVVVVNIHVNAGQL
jgi:hypothetical protein